jgi:ribosomal protein L12E/L44/L45/RPP1/RPP2
LQFQAALNEGIDYENQKKGAAREFVSKREAGRIMSEIGMDKVSLVITELTKEFNGKNVKAVAKSSQTIPSAPPAGTTAV